MSKIGDKIRATPEYKTWAAEVVSIMEGRGVPAHSDGQWHQFFKQGYSPKDVADLFEEQHYCSLAMNEPDDF